MSSIDAAPAPGTARRATPWTAVLGLLLLWGAFLSVAYFAVILTAWFVATLEQPGAAVSVDPISIAISAVPALLLLVVLVLASLRQRWARWAAVGLGLGGGILGLTSLIATASPAPETVAMAAAAIVGAVLLALPASSPYFRRRAD